MERVDRRDDEYFSERVRAFRDLNFEDGVNTAMLYGELSVGSREVAYAALFFSAEDKTYLFFFDFPDGSMKRSDCVRKIVHSFPFRPKVFREESPSQSLSSDVRELLVGNELPVMLVVFTVDEVGEAAELYFPRGEDPGEAAVEFRSRLIGAISRLN